MTPYRPQGYVTLISVIVIGVVGATVGMALLLFGTTAAKTNLVREQSIRARIYATSCAEEALVRIDGTHNFEGSGTLVWPDGRCGYTVTNIGQQNRDVVASSTVGFAVRKVHIIIDDLTPRVHVISWQEVAD
jgi:hypothetical protein